MSDTSTTLPTTSTRDAFELLSKPTLQLSAEERMVIFQDLRARRQRFLQGQADKPKRSSAAKEAVDDSPEAKAARSENLLNDLGNLF